MFSEPLARLLAPSTRSKERLGHYTLPAFYSKGFRGSKILTKFLAQNPPQRAGGRAARACARETYENCWFISKKNSILFLEMFNWLRELSRVLERFDFQILGTLLLVGTTWIQNTLILVGWLENSFSSNWTNFWVSGLMFLITVLLFLRW